MKIVLIFLVLALYNQGVDASRTNFEIKQLELCNSTQGLIKYYANITKEHGDQYLSQELLTPVEWGSNLGLVCLIETVLTEKHSVELFTIREKNICQAAKIYWGEFWYDLLRAEGSYNPTSCPQPAGQYHVHHFKLDFQKIALQTFPFGTLRFTLKAIDNKNPQTNMFCLIILAENIIG